MLRASCWLNTGSQDRVAELNAAAVKLARSVAADFSTPRQPRFVAGSIGPTTKLPSLEHIGFDDMRAVYVEQISALIDAGVDVLLIETCQDLLQAKIATIAAFDVMREKGKRLPLAGASDAGSYRNHAAGHRNRSGADRSGSV